MRTPFNPPATLPLAAWLDAPRPARKLCLWVTSTMVCLSSACATLPPVISNDPSLASADSTERAEREFQKRIPPRCYGYVLLVENGHSQPVEIYEVGNQAPRFVAVALIGITEVPMSDKSQQFVAMSRGEVMAASASDIERPSDRVALQRSCRRYQ